QVGVDLAGAALAPHQARREAVGAIGNRAARAALAAVQAGELATAREVEALGEADAVGEGEGLDRVKAHVDAGHDAAEPRAGPVGGRAGGPGREPHTADAGAWEREVLRDAERTLDR